MAAVLEDPLDSFNVRLAARRKWLRSPAMWMMEALRFSLYLVGSVVVPWLLVWPAIILWVLIIANIGDVRLTATALLSSLDQELVWAYFIGATMHSLTLFGARPYAREIDRRVEAAFSSWCNLRFKLPRRQAD